MIAKHIVPVLNELEDAGYKYCVLGGEGLPDKLTGSDIDILINRIDDNVENVFKSFGFVKSKGVQVFKGKPIVFCYFDAFDGWVPVHIVDPTLGGGRLIVPPDFSEYIQYWKGIAFASEELYFCATLMQSRQKGEITDKRLTRLKDKWYSPVFDRSECLDMMGNMSEEGAHVATELTRSNYLNIERVVNEGAKKNKAPFVLRLMKYALRRFKPKPKVKPGLVVSVEGIDGSGKSTFISYLNKTIPKEGRLLFYRLSMAGRGLGWWPRRFRSIWRRSCDKRGFLNAVLKSGLLPFVFVIEMLNFYYLYFSARRLAAKGYNVIFDRYACLHYIRQSVHNESEFVGKKSYIRALYYFAIKKFPSPDVFVFLSVDPLVAFSRKQEDDLNVLELKRRVYDCEVLPCLENKTEVYIADAALPTEEIGNRFLKRYWLRLV